MWCRKHIRSCYRSQPVSSPKRTPRESWWNRPTLGHHVSSLGNLHSAPTVCSGISGIQAKIQARFSRVHNLKTFWDLHIWVWHSSKSFHLDYPVSKKWPSLHIVVREHEWAPLGAITTRIKMENREGVSVPEGRKRVSQESCGEKMTLVSPFYKAICVS